MAQSTVERLLARDRVIVAVSLALCVVISAWYIVVVGADGMSSWEMSLET